MAKRRTLEVVVLGDVDDLDRKLKRGNSSLDKFGKQTRLTASVTSKGFSAIKVGATGAVAAVAGLAIAGKEVTEAAIESEAAMAKVRKMVINSGISWKAHSKEIDSVIQKHSQLTGIDDEELAESFANMVRTTGNLNEAFKLNALAADISRTKGLKLAGAQSLIARAYNGSFRGLKSLGIGFVETTAAQDKLRASGTAVTKQQLDAAKATDKLASRSRAMAALQKAFGGQAEAYGKTTAGSIDRAKVSFENLEEELGGALAPIVADAADGFARFVNEIQAGTGAGGRFRRVVEGMAGGVRDAAKWIGRATGDARDWIRSFATDNRRSINSVVATFKTAGRVAREVFEHVIAPAFRFALAVAKRAFPGIRSLFEGFGRAVKGVADVIDGIIHGDFRKAFGGLKGIVSGSVKAALGGLRAMTAPFREGASRLGKAAIGGLKALVGGFVRMGKDLASAVLRGITSGFRAGIGKVISGVTGIFKKVTGQSGDGIGRTIGEKAAAVAGAGSSLSGAIQGAVGPLPSGKDGGNLMGANPALRPFVALGASMGLGTSSGKRAAGGRTSSGGISYHGSGEAVDQAGPPAAMLRYFRAAKSRFGARLAELIYTPGDGGVGIKNGRPYRYTGQVARDHYDHVHTALDLGRPGPGIGDGMGASGQREPFTGDGIGEAARSARTAGFSGRDLVTAVAVAGPESGYRNAARLVTSREDSRSMWQINTLAHPWARKLNLTNSVVGARAARRVWQQAGRSWRPWTGYTSGAYLRFMDQARRAVIASRGGASASGTAPTPARSAGLAGGDDGDAQDRAASRLVAQIGRPFFRDTPSRSTAGRHGQTMVPGSRGITSLTTFQRGRARVIEDKDIEYGQAERRFGQSEEDLGTAQGREKRVSELTHLKALKRKQLAREMKRLAALQALVKKYDGLIAALRKKLTGPKKLRGAKAAKVREKIKEYDDARIEFAAEARSLGAQIEDTRLDIGDLAKELAEVAATPDAAAEETVGGGESGEAETPADKIGQALSDIDLQERAGVLTPEQAKAARVSFLQQALAGAFGPLDQRQQWELMAQLRDAIGEQVQAAVDLTQALADVKASIDAQLAFAGQVSAITSMQAVRAMADVFSGQLGQRTTARGFMPGDGANARL